MSALKTQLLAQLSRFDEEAFVALANRGLYRRAVKDLEKQGGVVAEDTEQCLAVTIAGHRVEFDARGPAHAKCSCPAAGVCHHILAAAISLQKLGAAPTEGDEIEVSKDPLAPLRETLLGLSAKTLTQHAGKAGYRWAWQFVVDLSSETPLKIGGETHLVLSFQRPRISLRFMGGGIESLLADIDIAQVEKYRVAAVLAYQQAHDHPLTPPEPTVKARSEALDLGQDHVVVNGSAATTRESRERLRVSVMQLLGECLELGLAHLSRGIHERFATLAVWAQGAEYHRLAMMLRRVADHVELLLERAGGADEHLLLDELTLAYGLVSALSSAAAQGAAPAHLVGRSRSSYESENRLELLGLGAYAWRSGSGYVGLTMLFWSPAEQGFLSCTDARPEGQRGFNAIARYKAAGPWSGLGAPALATGHRIVLANARTNAAGRLSAAESMSATVMPDISLGDFAAALRPQSSWTALAKARQDSQRSLLAEPQPMKDWVLLKPNRFGPGRFDAARQAFVWPLHDEEDQCLNAELVFSDFSHHAIARVEQLKPADLVPGTMLVARLRAGLHGLIAEPLSLVRPGGSSLQPAVDALHFDSAPAQGFTSKWLNKLRHPKPNGNTISTENMTKASAPALLRELRRALQRQAERGMSGEQSQRWLGELVTWGERAGQAGFTAFRAAASVGNGVPFATLQVNYLCLQFERLIVGGDAVQD